MDCLDCRQQETIGPAVGLCQSCGAAVCEAHADIGTRRIRCGMLTGAPHEATVRKVQCSICAAVQAPVPGAVSA